MPEPLGLLVGAVIGAGRAVFHVADLVQAPEEVDSATVDIYACERKLGELIELRKKHSALLDQRPDDLAAIETTISTAWRDLQKAKPILERNRIDEIRFSASRISRRIRWKVVDRNSYRLHEKTVLRNHIEVRDQINRLEQIVRLVPLEMLAEKSKEAERRQKDEFDARQASRDAKALSFLDPVVQEVKPEPEV
ncbi:hypothetical protein QBC35DRAFT_499787 [Podospora australis]|uniref:Uncharacterized protein n=1 Tax=Podospora australis TaxID=1536484 RepID=A0AAN7AIK0_9PEZI|nr:hypothetical protein QBC35DRAFT_499787 [Podospora australis]